ncbi:MAG: hypothetical protein AABY22_20865 [Nanoarchaeota archaeon]
MGNRNTKRQNKLNHKAKSHFHGSFCYTAYEDKKHNIANKRKSPYHQKRLNSSNE